jgi:hypothetical protein
MLRVTRLVFALVLFAGVAGAQEPLSLQIRAGKVTIKAQNVPLRTILTEWARVGGANVVGADRVAGAPVTIELTDVPERQALDVLLRGVSGYMLALRPAGTSGASTFNRILIMPPSAAPRALPPQAGGVPTRVTPVNAPDNDNDAFPEGVPEAPPGPARPGGPGVRFPNVVGQNTPTPAPLPGTETASPVPATPPAIVVTPGNPFGVPVGSSSRPGVVAPVAPQPQPGPRPDQN